MQRSPWSVFRKPWFLLIFSVIWHYQNYMGMNSSMNVANAQLDFQESPSFSLIMVQTFWTDVNIFLTDIETGASDPFYLPIVCRKN